NDTKFTIYPQIIVCEYCRSLPRSPKSFKSPFCNLWNIPIKILLYRKEVGVAGEDQINCWLDYFISNGYRLICSVSVITVDFGSILHQSRDYWMDGNCVCSYICIFCSFIWVAFG